MNVTNRTPCRWLILRNTKNDISIDGSCLNEISNMHIPRLTLIWRTAALAALRRRASEGGSYHVKVSLARTSTWIRSLGLQPRPARSVRLEMLSPIMEQRQTAYGVLEQMTPARLSHTAAHWSLPPAPLGAQAPSWAV